MKNLPYQKLYHKLKDYFAAGSREINIPELKINVSRRKFESGAADILPGKKNYYCKEHDLRFTEDVSSEKNISDALNIPDSEIRCNKEFDYVLMTGEPASLKEKVILLFHGLNEKKWDKYLPWAYSLLQKTGKPVLLFPLAFHMDRAPKQWSDARDMSAAAQKRAHDYSLNSNTSFVNAAISSRISSDPQRFFWSGLQSYIDVKNLLREIYTGRAEGFKKNTKADIFAYSIGVFFALILLMGGAGKYTNDSRLFAFCGGATLDRMYPISKYILDAKASSALGIYYTELLNTEISGGSRIEHYLGGSHPEESFFKSMLLYHSYKEEREKRLKEISHRVHAVVLKKDIVVPPVEVYNTLKGEMRDINIKVETEDFNYNYSHVNPFSLVEKDAIETDDAFKRIMECSAEFLN